MLKNLIPTSRQKIFFCAMAKEVNQPVFVLRARFRLQAESCGGWWWKKWQWNGFPPITSTFHFQYYSNVTASSIARIFL